MPEIEISTFNTHLPSQVEDKVKINPALSYLASLHSDVSRTTVASKLNVIAKLVGSASLTECDWEKMNADQVVLIMSLLGKAGRKGSTLNSYLAAMKGVAKAAWLAGQMDHERLLRIKAVNQVRYQRMPSGRFLSYKETGKLVHDCDETTPIGARDLAMVTVFLGCGLRRAEVAGLLLSQYDPESHSLRVVGKGDKERIAFLPDEAIDAFNNWLNNFRGSEPGPIFCRIYSNGRIDSSRKIDARALGVIMKKHMQNVTDRHFSTHDFRRTFATRLLSQNVDISTVQSMMGHASVTTTARYDRRGEKEKEAVARKIRI